MNRLARSPLALLFAVLVLRSAGFAFGILNIDESDFIVLGASISKGLLPYRDLVDIKPPLTYWTYLPAGLFGGMRVLPMRIVGVLWIFATAMVLRAAVREWQRTRDPEWADDAGWAAAWLYLLALLCEIPSLSGEALLNLPAAGALYFFARAQSPSRHRGLSMFACGLFAALASLYKHQGAILLIAFGAALALSALLSDSNRLQRVLSAIGDIALLALGFAIPWIACLAWYASLHQLPLFIEWVFTKNLQYAGEGITRAALERFLQSTLLCCGATLLPWILATRASWWGLRTREFSRDEFLFASTLLLWLTWLAVSAGGRFYEHYYLQFAPALAVLAAPEMARLMRAFPTLSPRLKNILILGCALPVLGLTGYSWARGISGNYPGQEPRAREVAAFLDAHSRPDETLFVWGHFTPIYVLSQRTPGTRYVHTSVHMGNFDPAYLPEDFNPAKFRSDQDVAATLEDLRTRQPALIVDTGPADIHNYRPIGAPAGAVVYRRNGTALIP